MSESHHFVSLSKVDLNDLTPRNDTDQQHVQTNFQALDLHKTEGAASVRTNDQNLGFQKRKINQKLSYRSIASQDALVTPLFRTIYFKKADLAPWMTLNPRQVEKGKAFFLTRSCMELNENNRQEGSTNINHN